MQPADSKSVLGDFSGKTFTYHGVTTTFSARQGKYLVRTDGPDGALHDYEVAYTFGVYPLQQYLVPFPGGRYQALDICWDARPAGEGGQRWFHLYPSETVTRDHPFHWTGPYQNWNFMCAECHSTNIHKGYRRDGDQYETTWSDIDVACEACHGPGSAHVAWASSPSRRSPRPDEPHKGFTFGLGDPDADRATWTFDHARGIAHRNLPRASDAELETCARCHARRAPVSEGYVYGRPLADAYRPALLDEGLYRADGQIQEEDYEYGSFLQSRMHAQGVTCSDCHEPHSLRVGARPDDACARCHDTRRFASPSHHFHKAGSPGASCVACHMPTRTYMVVHARHDHSLRVPRPDLSLKIGVPNACNGCHRDRSVQWAAATAEGWWGTARASKPHYGSALHAGRRLLAGAEGALVGLVQDAAEPTIVRATAVSLLGASLSGRSLAPVEAALLSPDPLVRLAAVATLGQLPPAERVPLFVPLLSDTVRTVRIDAARALAVLPPGTLPSTAQASFDTAFSEWTASQDFNGDRAEAHLNLGALHAERGELDQARTEYQTALRLNRWLPGAYLNLADLDRVLGDEAGAEGTLRSGLQVAPDVPDLHEALGLALVRQRRLPDALGPLWRAAELGGERPHYAYVYGVALWDSGRKELALKVLRGAYRDHTGDVEVLAALAAFSRQAGAVDEATTLDRELRSLGADTPGGASPRP
jgi:tetratricopeptide (TPR) repeat protein